MTDELLEHIACFRIFLDHLQLPVAIIDTHGRYVYYNRESADIDGCSVSDALGKPLLDVYPYLTEKDSTMLSSLKEGRIFQNHHQNYFNSRGKLINYTHTTTPLINARGEAIGAIEFGFDASGNIKLAQQLLALTKSAIKRPIERIPAERRIITRSSSMHNLIALSKRYAASDIPVIIYGPSGSGKELFAQLIVEHSTRCDKPFVVLNCGALTETLVESTLFGTVKGAYTGAENNEGYLELANGGTLFLDEFNSMSLNVQQKLLRYLQTKQYTRVGEVRPRVSDARILVAMNENPLKLIAEGRLREDLYYRLNVAVLTLPPLDERPEDILPLAEHFIEKYAALSSHTIHGIANPEALMRSWPGNVRMLENEIVRSIVMHETDGPLTIAPDPSVATEQHEPQNYPTSDLTFRGTIEPMTSTVSPNGDREVTENPSTDPAAPTMSLPKQLEALERRLVIEALNATRGNASQAAERLGIARTTLLYKMEKLGITIGVRTP